MSEICNRDTFLVGYFLLKCSIVCRKIFFFKHNMQERLCMDINILHKQNTLGNDAGHGLGNTTQNRPQKYVLVFQFSLNVPMSLRKVISGLSIQDIKKLF